MRWGAFDLVALGLLGLAACGRPPALPPPPPPPRDGARHVVPPRGAIYWAPDPAPAGTLRGSLDVSTCDSSGGEIFRASAAELCGRKAGAWCWCWGRGGPSFDPPPPAPLHAPVPEVTIATVVGNGSDTCILGSDGRVWCT